MFLGKKWMKMFGKIVEWVFYVIVVVLVVGVLFYLVLCFCVCCIGLDLLVEIWCCLGGWLVFDYFVNVVLFVVEIDFELLFFLCS